jgi:hypothetical protein
MDNNEYISGFFSEIIGLAIDNHSWYELTAIYFALAIPYYFTSKVNAFTDFMRSIYESRENSTVGMQLGAPIFIFFSLIFTLFSSFMVSGLYCLIFSKIHQALPQFTSNFSIRTMMVECAICFLFSFLVMTIGAVAKNVANKSN